MTVKTTRETVAELMTGGLRSEPDDEVETPEVETAAKVEAVPEPVETATDAEPELAQKSERARAADGKFAKAEAAKQAKAKEPAGADAKAAPAAAVALPAVPVATDLPALKPPADWRPAAKEKWAGLPREVQEESHRLHAEVKKTLQDSAQARQTAEAFQRTVAPFEHMFRAAGKSPVEGVGWLVQQYAALQTAPIPQRAGIVAGLIRDFLGTDEAAINLLASHLEGKGVTPASAPQSMRPEQVQELVRRQLETERQGAAQQAQLKAIGDFEATEPEFLSAVEPQMKALIMVEMQKGKGITPELLKQAHQAALRMNPETAAILKQRDDAAKAKENAAAAAKRAAAASGIKNEPPGPAGAAKATSTRDEVKRQVERLSRGGAHV